MLCNSNVLCKPVNVQKKLCKQSNRSSALATCMQSEQFFFFILVKREKSVIVASETCTRNTDENFGKNIMNMSVIP